MRARFLVVLGHNSCGAMDAAIALVNNVNTFPPGEWGEIGKIAAAIAPAVNIAKGQSGPGSLLDKSIDANAILNAQALAQREPILAPAVRARDLPLGVAAARFDIGTGEVTPLWTSFASI
jgi:carbonic anhydrase